MGHANIPLPYYASARSGAVASIFSLGPSYQEVIGTALFGEVGIQDTKFFVMIIGSQPHVLTASSPYVDILDLDKQDIDRY
jgi:hypothetical protein